MIDRAPVPDAQYVDDLLWPVHVDDRPVISNPEFVCLDGTEAGKIARGIQRDGSELARDSLSNGFVQLTEFFCREFGELDIEWQALIPLSSTVPEESSSRFGSADAIRKCPQSS